MQHNRISFGPICSSVLDTLLHVSFTFSSSYHREQEPDRIERTVLQCRDYILKTGVAEAVLQAPLSFIH